MSAERTLVEAGAGCGKTTSIITKFLSALESKKNGGKAYLPESCLLLTFTDAAAREMRVRIKEKAPELSLGSTYVGTFHAYCLNLLASARMIEAQAKILSDEELSLIIKDEFIQKLSSQKKLNELLSYLNMKEILNLTLWGSDEVKDIEKAFQEIESTWNAFVKKLSLKLNSLDLEEIDQSDWPQQALKLLEKDLNAEIRFSQKKILKEIVKKDPELLIQVKQLRGLQKKEILTPLLDFFSKEQDIFKFLAEELRALRATLPKYLTFTEIERRCLEGLRSGKIKAPKLSLIIVDEFQDTSPEQWEIIERISNPESDWYLVGDPKQSIYAFRKADIRLYKKLKEQINVVELSTNYRSAAAVLNATNKMQELFFCDAMDPSPQSLSAGRDYPAAPKPIVISEIEKWKTSFINEYLYERILKRNSDVPVKRHAVLFREWKKLYSFAEYLMSRKSNFQIQGSENHLDHFLSHCFLESLSESAKDNSPDYLSFFYEFCHLKEPQRWPQGAQWAAAMERLLVDLKSKDIHDWKKIVGLLLSGQTPGSNILNPVLANSEIDISLLTIHGSKGLEFDFVYLPDPRERASYKDSFEEDEIPFKYLVGPQLKSRSLFQELLKIDRSFKLESEQKRLFYVAITRAKLAIDFFIPQETNRNAAADDVPWWSLWRKEKSLHRFRWSKVLRSLDSSLAEFIEVKNETLNEKEELFFKPFNSSQPSLKEIKPIQKKSQSAEQIWGEELHAVLEVWNGDEASLEKMLLHFDSSTKKEMHTLLLELKACPELKDYWQALSDKKSDWKVLREEALIEQKTEQESFRYADVLMLKKDEALIIDWKTSLNEYLLSEEARKAKIKSQLELYAAAIRPKIPKVNTLAIGIFRDKLQVKALKL